MHVGKLKELLAQFPDEMPVAIKHHKRGFTSLQLQVKAEDLSVPSDYDRVDGGEYIKHAGGQQIVTIIASSGADAETPTPKNRPLFFCHIPKTAGGALTRSIRSLFAGSKVIDFESSAPLFRVSDRELASAAFLTGHAGANLACRLSPYAITMAVFRDPVKRVLSMYNFFLARGVIEPGLAKFVDSPVNRWAIDNLMTWQLVHDHTAPGRRTEPYRDWSSEQLQEEAMKVLHKLNIIGTADDLPEVLGRLESIYEMAPWPLERVNEVKKEVETPSAAEVEMIRSYNLVDQEIYKEALRIKDEAWDGTRQLVISLQPTNHFV